MSTEALVIAEPKDALAINRHPDIVLDEAKRAADAIAKVIEGKPKKVTFNGKTYLQFEDWQTVGRFYGVTALGTSTKYVEFGEGEEKVIGFEARADALLVGTNQVISSAEAMCLNDEKNWAGKPLFQLKSMAQTRAAAKALRNVLAWVVVLAGYSPTPAEEMTGDEEQSYVRAPQRKSQPVEFTNPSIEELNAAFAEGVVVQESRTKKQGKTISEKQQKRLFAISKSKGWEDGQVRELLGRYGHEHSNEILMSEYEAIVAEIQ